MTITSSVSTDLVHLASSRGASYADARTVEREHEAVSVKDGAVESVTRTSDRGFGFRVVHKGAWGFAASDRTDEASLRTLVDEAFRRAEASASVQRRGVKLAPIAPQRGEYRTSLERDPFSVPLAERIDHLRAVDAKSLGPNVKTRRSSVAAYRTRKRLVTSEGTDVSQEIVETGAGLSVLAVKAGRKPASRYDSRLVRQAGWEYVEHLDLVARAARYRDDAEATLDAPLATERPTTLVFAPEFLALLVHESCGHPTEADRLLEHEVAFAGTTFMWPESRGKLRYGSAHVSMTADATLPGGMGTFGWDDDGVPGMRTKLVDKGIFVGYHVARDGGGARPARRDRLGARGGLAALPDRTDGEREPRSRNSGVCRPAPRRRLGPSPRSAGVVLARRQAPELPFLDAVRARHPRWRARGVRSRCGVPIAHARFLGTMRPCRRRLGAPRLSFLREGRAPAAHARRSRRCARALPGRPDRGS